MLDYKRWLGLNVICFLLAMGFTYAHPFLAAAWPDLFHATPRLGDVMGGAMVFAAMFIGTLDGAMLFPPDPQSGKRAGFGSVMVSCFGAFLVQWAFMFGLAAISYEEWLWAVVVPAGLLLFDGLLLRRAVRALLKTDPPKEGKGP